MALTEYEKNQLAEENYNLIFGVVKKFQANKISSDELTSIAHVGFAKALNGYDESKGVKFSTYATTCMINEVLHFLRKEKKHMQNNVSLNQELKGDVEDLYLEDIVSEKNTRKGELHHNLEESALLNDDIEILGNAIEKLSDREQLIIKCRYGLFGEEIKTQREIAKILNLSQANICKLEKGIVEKLYRFLNGRINLEENGYYKDIDYKRQGKNKKEESKDTSNSTRNTNITKNQ